MLTQLFNYVLVGERKRSSGGLNFNDILYVLWKILLYSYPCPCEIQPQIIPDTVFAVLFFFLFVHV